MVTTQGLTKSRVPSVGAILNSRPMMVQAAQVLVVLHGKEALFRKLRNPEVFWKPQVLGWARRFWVFRPQEIGTAKKKNEALPGIPVTCHRLSLKDTADDGCAVQAPLPALRVVWRRSRRRVGWGDALLKDAGSAEEVLHRLSPARQARSRGVRQIRDPGPVPIIIDSTGPSVYVGPLRKPPRNSDHRKLHFGVDEQTGF